MDVLFHLLILCIFALQFFMKGICSFTHDQRDLTSQYGENQLSPNADKYKVQHLTSESGPDKISTWDEAYKVCFNHGFNMATISQLGQAAEEGYSLCDCGWLADGSVNYPHVDGKPRCDRPSNFSCVSSSSKGFDVYCSTVPPPVIHLESDKGSYTITSLMMAKAVCASQQLEVATEAQLYAAWKLGYDMCACGWLADGNVKYPVTYPRPQCGGSSPAGLKSCPTDKPPHSFDVYCAKKNSKDVTTIPGPTEETDSWLIPIVVTILIVLLIIISISTVGVVYMYRKIRSRKNSLKQPPIHDEPLYHDIEEETVPKTINQNTNTNSSENPRYIESTAAENDEDDRHAIPNEGPTIDEDSQGYLVPKMNSDTQGYLVPKMTTTVI